jgi:glycerophosphoryl diester phosphodiesterase
MKSWNSFFLFCMMACLSCSKSEITLPPFNADSNLENTTFIDGAIMKKMEGIYLLSNGSEKLGKEFVCKVSKFKVSFFSNKEGIFIILKYGFNPADGSIQFSGFWRYSENTTQGNILFSLSSADGADDLLKGMVSNFKLNGDFFQGNANGESLSLKYEKQFSQYALDHEFMVFAHHGVETTSNPPYAENSIKGVLNVEDYGVSGIEFDIRMTKDNVPVCIHDPTINVRLTQKGPLSGNWDQYSFSFISEYIRLIDGQKVPSVEQVLTAFIDSTTLKYFWMDIKGNPDVFKHLEPVVRNAYAHAASKNRNVIIFAGLPSSDVIGQFNMQPTYSANNPGFSYSLPLPTLCEESLQKAIDNRSSFFGPRFSQGLLLDEVEKAHSQGIKVISWTLNGKNIIKDYLKNGKFDGFITDYPAYVVYNFYTLY